MHPSQTDLRKYAEGMLSPDARQNIDAHLAACDLCRELVGELKLYIESVMNAARESLPQAAKQLAEQAFSDASRGRIIHLMQLGDTVQSAPLLLAADSSKPPTPDLQNLATLYSENPEVVLRVMRDSVHGQDYVQLIAEATQLAAHALIRIPELDQEIVTDGEGRANVNGLPDRNLDDLKWQIKLPDAQFDLQPVSYDPNRTEYEAETILQTDRDDKIRVTFEGKTEGKQIRLEILRLEGRTDFGPVSLLVAQGAERTVLQARPHQAVSLRLTDPSTPINIRVFE